MILTPKQSEALETMRGIGRPVPPRHFLCVGGSRSGKTTLLLRVLAIRAIRYPESRHIIARLRFNHAKVSLWLDSLPKVISELLPSSLYNFDGANYRVQLWNGSEIWVDGLDSEARVEKILGREYATAYLNEGSQLDWNHVLMMRTRLAQNIAGCRTLGLYDCNPPTFRHWTYKAFIDGVDPQTGEPISNWSEYAWTRINPIDNRANLPPGYIESELESLPEAKRRRFLLGEWASDVEGQIFTDFDIVEKAPEKAKVSIGLDFGFTVDPASIVRAHLAGDDLYLEELFYDTGATNAKLADAAKALGLAKYRIKADCAEPKSIDELGRLGLMVSGATKGPDSVRAGIDWIKAKRLHIVRPSPNLLNELYEYRYLSNKGGRVFPVPIDEFNHAIDAARYACEDWMSGKRSGVIKVGAT